jgi:hypothetical protein
MTAWSGFSAACKTPPFPIRREKSGLRQAKTWGNYGGFKDNELDVFFRGQEGIYRRDELIRRDFPFNGQGQSVTYPLANARSNAATVVGATPLTESRRLKRCESALRISQALEDQSDIARTRVIGSSPNSQTRAFD